MALGPAVLGKCIRQPRRIAVVHEGGGCEERHEEPGDRLAEREVRALADGTRPAAVRRRQPPDQRGGGCQGEDEHGCPPGAADIGERHREPRGDRRADLDPTGVDARDEHGVIGEALLDGDDHERVAEPHADADRHRQRDHGEGPGQDRSPDTADRDQRQGDGDRANGAHARGQRCGRRCEDAHPDHGNGPEQRRHGVADAERVLCARQHRAEADELRAQCQRCEGDRDQQPDAAPQRAPIAHRSSYRGFRFSTNAATPSAKSWVPRRRP